MNNSRTSEFWRGFTLMEMMVAMAITTIIVTVLVLITSVAMDNWNRSRSELRASRQARSMIDTMSRDFETLVTRNGNAEEWLSAISDPDLNKIGDKLVSTNASRIIFFTAATDRYNGGAGTLSDKGGDVSCVAYKLDYKDPLAKDSAVSTSSEFKTFVFNRLLVNPDETFAKLLGKTDVASALPSTVIKLEDPVNFICENIYQFTVTFHVEVTDTTVTPAKLSLVPVRLGSATKKFRILGTGIDTDYSGADSALVPYGRITAIEVSVTVLSDFGIDQLKKRNFSAAQQSEFLAKNSYQYTKLVQIPSL